MNNSAEFDRHFQSDIPDWVYELEPDSILAKIFYGRIRKAAQTMSRHNAEVPEIIDEMRIVLIGLKERDKDIHSLNLNYTASEAKKSLDPRTRERTSLDPDFYQNLSSLKTDLSPEAYNSLKHFAQSLSENPKDKIVIAAEYVRRSINRRGFGVRGIIREIKEHSSLMDCDPQEVVNYLNKNVACSRKSRNGEIITVFNAKTAHRQRVHRAKTRALRAKALI